MANCVKLLLFWNKRDFKGTVSPDIGLYFRYLKIKSVPTFCSTANSFYIILFRSSWDISKIICILLLWKLYGSESATLPLSSVYRKGSTGVSCRCTGTGSCYISVRLIFFISRVMYVDLHSRTIFEATGILFCFEDCSFLLPLKPEPSNILLLT